MNKILFVILGVVFLMLAAGRLLFAEPQVQPSDAAQVAVKEPINVGNKICPVSGEKAGAMGPAVPYEYEGRIYNLCCPACVEPFKKDPQKYIKKAEEELKAEKEMQKK